MSNEVRSSDQARIQSLIDRVRHRIEGRTLPSPEQLARQFRLDPLVVRSILISEGMSFADMVRGKEQAANSDAELEQTARTLPSADELRRTGS